MKNKNRFKIEFQKYGFTIKAEEIMFNIKDIEESMPRLLSNYKMMVNDVIREMKHCKKIHDGYVRIDIKIREVEKFKYRCVNCSSLNKTKECKRCNQ